MKQKGMLLGLVLMIIGIVCWLMVKYVLYDIKVLYPVGCIILCVGGLIVTINLFINTVKAVSYTHLTLPTTPYV